jgi:2,5-furandicarboxylate decarboxylase 1
VKDLSSFLASLAETMPAQYAVERERAFDPRLQLSAYVAHCEKARRFPVMRFDRVCTLRGEPSPYPVVTNLFAARESIAAALGLRPEQSGIELAIEFQRRVTCEIAPQTIASSEAPCQEVAAGTDLHQLPALTHHIGDRGPYLTTVAVARDPDTGTTNVSFHRAMVLDASHLTVFLEKRHLWDYYTRAMAHRRPLPIAFVLGHHPAFLLGACALTGIEVDEYRTIGGLLGEPLRLAPSQTFGDALLVPADAEIVVEGEIRPGALADEGPFGDFTGYYSPCAEAPVMEVTAITHRRGALFVDVFVGHRDHALLGSIPKEGGVFDRVRAIVPGVRAVALPESGTGRLHCYIAIEKRVEGEARLAAMAAFTSSELIKHVIVVDEDIDVFDDREVLWAIATRVQAERDVETLRGVKGSRLDPSAPDPDYASKLIVDATRPLGGAFPERLRTAEWVEE